MKAFLNCVTKKITFAVDDVSFGVDLTEGDLHDSINAIISRRQIYDTRFTWDEGEDIHPCFSVIPVVEVVNDEMHEKYLQADWDNEISYDVQIVKGGQEDYFGVVFPNGFLSFTHTFGVMCDRTIEKQYNGGRIAFLELLKKLAMKFENQYNVGDTYWEDHQWDETLEEFLTKNLNF